MPPVIYVLLSAKSTKSAADCDAAKSPPDFFHRGVTPLHDVFFHGGA